jgi:hypothetical protein
MLAIGRILLIRLVAFSEDRLDPFHLIAALRINGEMALFIRPEHLQRPDFFSP